MCVCVIFFLVLFFLVYSRNCAGVKSLTLLDRGRQVIKESIVEAQVETHTSDYHLHAEKWTIVATSATPEYKFLPL